MKRCTAFIFFLILFFCITNAVMADTDMIGLQDTAHTYTGGGIGSFSIDGDWDTSQSAGSGGDYDSSVTLTSTHTFAIPRTITVIKYRMFAGAHVYGDSEQICDIHYKVEYYDGAWHTVPGTQFDDSRGGNSSVSTNSGIAQISVNLPNTTAVRAWVYAHTHSNGDSRTEESSAGIYEIQAFGNIDIGLRAYDGTGVVKIACEPGGILTSPLRICKNQTTYSVVLVDPADPRASKIRIGTKSGIKALEKRQ